MDEPSCPRELRGILDTVTVGEVTRTGYPMLSPDDSVQDAIAAMRRSRHGSVIVCRDDRLVGVFTERDLLRVVHEGRVDSLISEVMTANPQSVDMTDPLITATRLMDEGGYRRLPVLDVDGRPCGVVDVKAITHLIVEHFPEAVYNQAAHAQLIARHREGA
ncbi:MAG: cyclic nucleotide-binding/CBS domain-containing protein [Planctomycetaceae bacterium]